MSESLKQNYYRFYVPNPLVAENSYRHQAPQRAKLPIFGESQAKLPDPFWTGHGDAIDAYWKTWRLAFKNLRRPSKSNGFVANYIDTAFNRCLFMWDSCFILLFARYGARAFDFQRTLDNLYAKQHPDGFICREIRESDGTDCFFRFDPSATGPNILAWAEWEHFLSVGDRARLKKVFPALAAFHHWMRRFRTWPDGSYWASGWACGMDNQPRVPEGFSAEWDHAGMAWADTCLQQMLSARLLSKMAALLKRPQLARDFAAEARSLGTFVNAELWDPKRRFYFDRLADGSLGKAKSIGAYWALLAGAVPAPRRRGFIAHLDDPRAFKRPHRVPTLSADNARYRSDGGYWRGGVWPPTNYMVLRGLSLAGEDGLAHAIAMNHLGMLLKVFKETGTVWENYAPESAKPGKPAKADFVGWSGLGPVAVLFEYVFGLRPDVPGKRLLWDLRLLEGHGVRRYPFGKDALLDLSCAPRRTAKEAPKVSASSSRPLTLELRWQGGRKLMKLGS